MSSVTIQPGFFSLMLNTYLWEMLILNDDALKLNDSPELRA